MLTLYPWQEVEVAEALNHNSWLLAAGMGLGKTLMAVEWARRKEDTNVVVIVAPLNTRRGWERTFKSQMPDMPFHRLENNAKNRLNFLKLAAKERGVYIISWELMRGDAITGQVADLVIADEVHRATNSKTAQRQALGWIETKYKLGLSGTPAGNRPQGIWPVLNWLWPTLFKSYWKWVDQHWVQRRNGAVIDLIREIVPGSIVAEIPMYTRIHRKDHRQDMPAVLPEIQVDVELTPAQRKIYKQFDELALSWVNGYPVPTAYPLEKDIRLKQVALGVPKVVPDEDGFAKITFDLDAKSSKMDALLDIIKDQPEEDSFLVLVHSAQFIPTAVNLLNKKGIKAHGFWGDTKHNERERLLDELGDTYRVMVAGIAAIGEGTDGLQYKCHNMVWLSKHGNNVLNKQAAERLDRPGQTEPVNVWYINAVDTKDNDFIEHLEELDGNLAVVLD